MDTSRLKEIITRIANKAVRVEKCQVKEPGLMCPACRTLMIQMKDTCTEWLSEYERLEKKERQND